MPDVRVGSLLPENALHDIREFADVFGREGQAVFSVTQLSRKVHLATFVSMCRALGAIDIRMMDAKILVRPSGRLGLHVPEMLSVYLTKPFTVIENWSSTHIIPEDRLSALEFVHQLELRRIEQERRFGRVPKPLAERPVSFVVFRAKNDRGEDCYLFELNKDWRRLNLIGGKQEPQDAGDFQETAHREVAEELGIGRSRLTLTRLNETPLMGYSLSGNVGSLARYPCVLFGAQVEGSLKIRRMQDRWLTEETIRRAMDHQDSPLMVHPVYLAFLLSGRPSRLSKVPLSTDDVVRSTPMKEILPNGERVIGRWSRVVRENKDLVAAVLTLAAVVLGAVLAL